MSYSEVDGLVAESIKIHPYQTSSGFTAEINEVERFDLIELDKFPYTFTLEDPHVYIRSWSKGDSMYYRLKRERSYSYLQLRLRTIHLT